jgi:RND family efflux transporter MFP subunit
MNDTNPVRHVSLRIAGLFAAAAVGVGAVTMYWWMRPRPSTGSTPVAESGTTAQPSSAMVESTAPATVMLSEDAIRRAGVASTSVEQATGIARLRLPAVVEPNRYAEVVVTPIANGRVTRVGVELGDQVTEGQPLAEIFSSELAEVQARYLTMSSEFDAAHERLRRTERLVEIGAASRQELDRVKAEHTTHATDVESARARLRLLGLSADEIAAVRTAPDLSASIRVTSPRAGVVVERFANVGLNVDVTTPLFRVVDLTTVWVIAELHERDFAGVTTGSLVTVSTADGAGVTARGRVAYIDPQVRPETRTARLRIELPNPGRRLRLGMYVDVVVDGATMSGPVVPRGALQSVGSRQVVYVADPSMAGMFVEREVRLGAAAGDRVVVTSGLAVGEKVVSEGSFFVRAEAQRAVGGDPHAGMNMGGTAGVPPSPPTPPRPAETAPADTLTVRVGSAGFEPARLTIPRGRAARVTFIRTTDATCATEIVVPGIGVRRALPLDQPVTIDVPPQASGTLDFACGMNMFKGTIVVSAR